MLGRRNAGFCRDLLLEKRLRAMTSGISSEPGLTSWGFLDSSGLQDLQRLQVNKCLDIIS